MIFNKIVQLSVLAFCVLGAKSALAAHKIEEAIRTLESRKADENGIEKTNRVCLKLFDVAFKAKQLNACQAAIAKINFGLDIDTQFKFFDKYNKTAEEQAFFEQVIGKAIKEEGLSDFFKSENEPLKKDLKENKEAQEKPKKNAKKKNKKYTIDAYRRTELQNLVRAGNLKGVQSTLASNCSAEYFNMQAGERKIHVLHYAAGRVNLENGFEIAKLLITYAVSKGYDLNVKTLSGRTPLDVARDYEHTGLIELLEQQISTAAVPAS